MISTMKLIQMAQKWQKIAAIRQKRIPLHMASSNGPSGNKDGKKRAQKGHFVVYTVDERRFVISLSYLSSTIIRELFKISEEEFGIPNSGRIVLPIDSSSMEYIVSLIRRGLAKDLEDALLLSITSSSCSSAALDRRFSCRQVNVCS